MLVEHLAQMFPEEDDAPAPPFVPPDRHHQHEYRCSELVTYLLCDAVRRFGYNDNASKVVDDANSPSKARSGEDGGASAWARWRANLASASTGGANAEHAKAALRACEAVHTVPEAAQKWLQIHPGCTFGQILRHHEHVVAGGIVNLTVFPRASQAHKEWRRREARCFAEQELLPPKAR